VLPAFNAEKTLKRTFEHIPPNLRSNIILVDDCSTDKTVEISESLGIKTFIHNRNLGYGGNQKTCYQKALESNAEVIVMLHPDFQYDSRVVGIMADLILLGICDVILGNRIRTRREALDGGMPIWKYLLNRSSTFIENLVLGQSIGDFHSGLRAYKREVLENLPFEKNSDDFAFDQELLVQAIHAKYRIGDIPVPVRYLEDSSSINLSRSLRYGVGGFMAVIKFVLNRTIGLKFEIFSSTMNRRNH